MSSWWNTAKHILSGKPKGSKLIVLGVFLLSVGTTIEITIKPIPSGASYFLMIGLMLVMWGYFMYREEAQLEMKKKYS